MLLKTLIIQVDDDTLCHTHTSHCKTFIIQEDEKTYSVITKHLSNKEVRVLTLSLQNIIQQDEDTYSVSAKLRRQGGEGTKVCIATYTRR